MGFKATNRRSPPGQEAPPDFEQREKSSAVGHGVLEESISHDYSTSENGIVPLDRRRPLWHFAGLWTTFAAGFSFLFLGFELHDGHSLPSVVGISAFGFALYVAYAMFGSYLGSRTGQTHGLLTRSIFGRGGSWVVSAFVLVAALGRLSSRADGADLGWPLRLGARFWADARVHRPHDCE